MTSIHNVFGYNAIYDEKLLGKACISKVKDLPEEFKVKRAGCILYIQEIQKEIITSTTNIISDYKQNNVWRNGNTHYQKNSTYKNGHNSHSSLVYADINNFVSIVNNKPRFNKHCTIIPEKKITIRENIIIKNYYCMGIDSNYQTLTDFGGKVKRTEDSIAAALRELEEESYGIFKIKKENIKDNIVIYNNEICILFIKIDIDSDTLNRRFNELYKARMHENKKCEISELKWLNITEFVEAISTPYVIYEPIRELLNEQIGNVSKNI